MSKYAVDAIGVKKSYQTGSFITPVLVGIDLKVEPGECVFLSGPSGSGKSTLLSILGCILTADEGTVEILGENVTHLNRKGQARFRRERIGFVFQRFHLFQGLRAWENVAVPFDLQGVGQKISKPDSLRLLDMVGLAAKANNHISQLSLGQRQRVALARALAGNPDLIFADEPTASLDFESGYNAMKILRDLCKEMGKTCVVVTHDPRIYPMADRILTMEDGRFTMVRFNPRGGMGGMVQKL
ncbi:MAG: ABC transporter ATP-binding protein [Planctomycetota bacterium]